MPASTPPAPDMAGGAYLQSGYEFFRWSEGLRIMIWHDAVSSSGCGSSVSTRDRTHVVECFAISQDGQRVDWRLETDDGLTALFTIDGATYDLGSGNLFLVSTAGVETEVRQAQRDLSGVEPQNDSILEFSLKDEDIQAFIQSTSSN